MRRCRLRRFQRKRIHIAVLVGYVLGCGHAAPSPPDDEALISDLRNNRAVYDTLLVMFHADSALGRVASTFTRPANFFSGGSVPAGPPVTADRLAEYRRLFDRLSLIGGIEGYDRKRVIFFWRYAAGGGAGLGGSSKGLAYSDSLAPDKPASSGCTTPRDDCWKFRPIADGWFVLEERHN